MKLNEYAENYFHDGFIRFDYVTDMSGYVVFKDFAGDVFRRLCYVDEGKRFRMGSIYRLNEDEQQEQQIDLSIEDEEEEELLTKSIQVKLTERQHARIKKIAKSCNVKTSSYVRNLVQNDIIRADLEEARGYSIL